MTKINHYDIGDQWVVQSTFTVGGTPTDPTNVTFKHMNPAGTVTTVGPVAGGTGGSGIVRVGAGVFKYPVPLDTAGYWFARFEGTGTAAATEDHQAIVDPSMFTSSAGVAATALVGLAETKDWLQYHNIDTSNDLDIVRAINDISERFSYEASREFKVLGSNPQTRLFWIDAQACRHGIVPVGDLASITTARILDRDWTTEVKALATTDYKVDPPVAGRPTWAPTERLIMNPVTVSPLLYGQQLEIAGTWGFPSVPGSVRQAVLDAVATTLDRDVEHYRQDLAPIAQAPDAGTTLVLGGGPFIASLPPAALAVARSFANGLVA